MQSPQDSSVWTSKIQSTALLLFYYATTPTPDFIQYLLSILPSGCKQGQFAAPGISPFLFAMAAESPGVLKNQPSTGGGPVVLCKLLPSILCKNTHKTRIIAIAKKHKPTRKGRQGQSKKRNQRGGVSGCSCGTSIFLIFSRLFSLLSLLLLLLLLLLACLFLPLFLLRVPLGIARFFAANGAQFLVSQLPCCHVHH